MTDFFSLVAAIGIIKLLQLTGKVLLALAFKTHDHHIQIGYSPSWMSFTAKGVRIDIGWIVPLPFLLKIYSIIDGEKHPLGYPWEFFHIAWWKRLVATFGAVYLLVPTAIIIFSWVAYQDVETYVSKKELDKYGIYAGSLGREVGFKTGDRILSINNQSFDKYEDIFHPDYMLETETTFKISRDGEKLEVVLPVDFIDRLIAQKDEFIEINNPFVIGGVGENSPADQLGLQIGDKIIKANNDSIYSFPQFRDLLVQNSSNSIEITFKRNSEVYSGHAIVSSDGKLGFYAASEVEYTLEQKTIGEAIASGTKKSFQIVGVNLRAFRKIFSPTVSETKTLSGPVGVARVFGGFRITRFLNITAILMMLTAFANLLPLPSSAFIQLIPLFYEKLTGKEMALTTYHKILYIPYFVLAGMMALVLVGDILQIITK
ncbi:MAG: PDZ domain-containing protein [Bacteroidota bacterium]